MIHSICYMIIDTEVLGYESITSKIGCAITKLEDWYRIGSI